VLEYELGDHTVGIQAEVPGVLADEGAREHASGKDLESVLFDGCQEARADLRRLGHVAQAHTAQLALSTEILTEGGHRPRRIRATT
jgi:hypothetical protein